MLEAETVAIELGVCATLVGEATGAGAPAWEDVMVLGTIVGGRLGPVIGSPTGVTIDVEGTTGS